MAIYKYKTNQTLQNSGFNQSSGNTLTLSGNTIIADTGTFQYLSDKSSTYVARSVVDAEYVTGLTSAIDTVGSATEIIYRGIDGISGATDFTYTTSGVTIPNLCISQTPETDVGDYFLLTWDSGTTKVNKVNAISATGLQSASNGLCVSGSDVRMGGTLTEDTTISGSSNSFCIVNLNDYINLENLSNGGIYLKSQSTAIPLFQSSFNNAVGFKVDYNDGFKVYDNRVGASQVGIEYADNYAGYYTSRSLVDKNYVDAVAAGIQPHDAVIAATTGNTLLSGITGITIIDGIEITVPISITDMRVLIKNQTDAKENGIYVLTGGTTGGTGTTFVRAYDFNESSESVQGAYTFVLSGNSQQSTSWVLSTPNPILIDVTPLLFTLFNQLTTIIAGHGINIDINYGEHTISVDGQSLVGNSLSWDGTYFNVDITGGTLGTALSQVITGATNGLTKVGQDVILGGTLTGATFTGGLLQYGGDYSNNYIAQSIPDAGYLTGYTQSAVTTALSQVITGATNGLTKVGQDVCLGGTLDANTTINAGSNFLAIQGSTAQNSVYFDDAYVSINRRCIDTNSYSSALNVCANTTKSEVISAAYDLTTNSCNIVYSKHTGDFIVMSQGTGGSTKNYFCFTPTANTIVDAINSKGIVYGGDYEANFEARSLVTAQYVTGITSGQTGSVTSVAALTIATTGTDITSSVADSTTTPVISLCIPDASAANRGALTSTDWGTFNNKTTCVGTVTGANNGICATSTTVSLGGVLTGDTALTGAHTLSFTHTAFNMTAAVCITGAMDTSSTLGVGGAMTLDSVAAGSVSDDVLTITSGGEVQKISASSLGENNNTYVLSGITTTITLDATYYVVLADAFIITLPIAPATGLTYKIKDSGLDALTNNITIAGNGKNIDGSAMAIINTDGGGFEIVYDGTAWFVLSFMN